MTTLQPITWFRDKDLFLSNFYSCRVEYQSRAYPSSEHAFQASKTFRDEEREWIAKAATPGLAKMRGRQVCLRKDWDDVKLDLMETIVRAKFGQCGLLVARLLATCNRKLVEGNIHGDKFWGECKGVGQNHLGRILMKVRWDLNMVVNCLKGKQELSQKTAPNPK